MSTAPRTKLTLELEHDEGPIRGTLSDNEGTESQFHGWLELTQRIDGARQRAQPASNEMAFASKVDNKWASSREAR